MTTHKKVIDSGAGFFLDEEDIREEKNVKVTQLPRNIDFKTL